VDSLDDEKRKNLDALCFSEVIDENTFISHLDKFKKEKIEAIFHQGACSDTMETDEGYIMRNNYEYSKSLLNFCLEQGIRFIYASSASVYGNGENGFKEEDFCKSPLNLYALSKSRFDDYVLQIKKPETQIVGLRYFNVYGPQENHKRRMASVIYHFYNQIMSEGKIKIFEGSDNFRRDFVSVDDVTKINLRFFENPEWNGIFNCGTGKARSFLELARNVQRLYGEEVTIESVPFPEALKGKYQKFTQADLTHLREIGYKDEFASIEEGIPRYIKVLQDSGGYLTK
jgi:ADP-L-glycero-D-manno-heptose 6-epimerase